MTVRGPTSDAALTRYRKTRDELLRGSIDVTDRIASFEWDTEEVRRQHLVLAREMSNLVLAMRTLH